MVLDRPQGLVSWVNLGVGTLLGNQRMKAMDRYLINERYNVGIPFVVECFTVASREGKVT